MAGHPTVVDIVAVCVSYRMLILVLNTLTLVVASIGTRRRDM